MKKILLFSLIVFTLVGCKERSKRFAKQQEALATNIQIDTTMFGVCFNDNPEIVKSKLKLSGYYEYNYQFEYKFPDERLNDIYWKWNDLHSFHNDSLFRFCLEADISSYKVEDALKALKEIYSLKYGEAFEENNELYWYKGNLEISIHFMKEYPTLFIEYSNLKNCNHGGQELKYENYNSYTLDYWNRTYKAQKEEELKKSTKEI